MPIEHFRTDLAQEAASRLDTPCEGLVTSDTSFFGVPVSLASVTTAAASKAVGKPIGDYYTMSLANGLHRTDPAFSDHARALARILRELPMIGNGGSFLVACLGNAAITPDALGPSVADSLIITRHLLRSGSAFPGLGDVCALKTGVLGTTGIETADKLRAVCSIVKPDCVIAVDALAAGSPERLCRSVQVCDSGISPGSGVGNDRDPLNDDTLGCPVVAVGVPTVIDAAALSDSPELAGMFVTPRGIDELIRSAALVIAAGIDLALHPGLSLEDVLGLMN